MKDKFLTLSLNVFNVILSKISHRNNEHTCLDK